MWILPKQLHENFQAPLVSAQGMAELKEDLSKFSEAYEFSLFQKSKPTQSRTFLRRWKQENWKLHLCGRILKPSQVLSFEMRLIFSLADFRASRLVQQEDEQETKTQDTSSPTLSKQSEECSQGKYYLKMSQEFYQPDLWASTGTTQQERPFCSISAESWKEKVTEWKQEYSARKNAAHLIRESESSSSQNWPTPTLPNGGSSITPEQMNTGKRASGSKVQIHLQSRVELSPQNWPTPQAQEGDKITGRENQNSLTKTCRNGQLDPESSNLSMKRQEPIASLKKWKLNPTWVEQLMGLPQNWTQLPEGWRTVQIDCASVETVSCLKQPSEPTELYQQNLLWE